MFQPKAQSFFSENKKIIIITVGLVVVALLGITIWYLFFYKPNTIGPIEPNPPSNQLTAEQAISLIIQNYPKVIQARGSSEIPDESIKQTKEGWQIDVFWGWCPECHCVFEVKNDETIEVIDAGESPQICEREQITITTDKTEYGQEEIVNVTTKNNTEKPITIFALFEFIEKLEENEWREIDKIWKCPCGFACDFTIDEILEPGQERLVSWDQAIGNPCYDRKAETGIYRIGIEGFIEGNRQKIYSNEFEIVGLNAEAAEITLTGARGDFVDPGPMEAECQKHLANYINGIDFRNKGFKACQLAESKVGMGDAECFSGWSPIGCYICELKCQ